VPRIVYLNGAMVSEQEAKVSVFDHGFLYGDGIFETMRSYEGRVFKLDEHLKRLFSSAQKIELKLPLTEIELAEAITSTLKSNQLTRVDGYIRLSISRGEGPLGIDPRVCPRPNVVIMAKEIGDMEHYYTQGLKIITVKTKRNLIEALDPAIKSFNFLNNIMAKLELNRAGVTEGLMENHRGYIAEGTISNVFIVKDKKILTPPKEAGILVGITRNTVIELANNTSSEVLEENITKEDIYQAEEVFLTNSSGEIMPVVEINGHIIGLGTPGKVTLELLQLYRKEARKN